MGAGQSIDSNIQELKSVSEKLKSEDLVKELKGKIDALITVYKAKISSGNESATVVGDAKGETPAATGAAPETTTPAPAKQEGGKRLKKRRISNKKRVSHRLTRSLKLI